MTNTLLIGLLVVFLFAIVNFNFKNTFLRPFKGTGKLPPSVMNLYKLICITIMVKQINSFEFSFSCFSLKFG